MENKNLETRLAQTVRAARFNNIDFLRFLLALGIIYLHLCAKLMHLSQGFGIELSNIYKSLANQCNNANMIVECFFIIAGFFLAQTFTSKKPTWSEFAIRKIIRLWPVLAFYTFANILVNINNVVYFDFHSSIINLLFLQNIGLTPGHTDYNWYISALFWALLFYYYILYNFKKKYSNLAIALCVYFSLLGIINCHSQSFEIYKIDTYLYFFNAGLMRAIAGVGIGYFIAAFFNKTKTYIENNFNNTRSFAFVSFVEIATFIFLVQNFFFVNLISAHNLIFYIAFCILFFSFLIKKGILSKLLETKYLGFFGKYSYSIYVMQGLAFLILQNFLWHKYAQNILLNPFLCISISLTVSILLGVLTYYLIEKPATKYLNNKLKKFLKN